MVQHINIEQFSSGTKAVCESYIGMAWVQCPGRMIMRKDQKRCSLFYRFLKNQLCVNYGAVAPAY